MPLRIAIILALGWLPTVAVGQNAARDDFEGPQTTLVPAGGDARHQVELHQRTAEGAHSGRWCEQLRITGNNGTAVYYNYPITPARVIGELAAGVWLRADRPGLQIVARVVLPRSKHPDSGEPLTTLVRGSDYRQVGSWQLVRVDNLPRALEWQVRVLRSQFGPQVDPREAYVDRVLLNVYGGPGTTNVWIDDFELAGTVAPPGLGNVIDEGPEAGNPALYAADTVAAPAAVPAVPSVELNRLLLVGGEPFFPRIIEHRGEPLSRLKALGFNCVRVATTPSRELLGEAAKSGMWLVAPPPPAAQLATRPGAAAARIGGEFDPVLAWDLGSGLSNRDRDAARRLGELVQAADARRRPIVVGAESELGFFTRPPFKVLLAERESLGTSLDLSQFADWLANRAQLAKAGAPLWTTIPTQPSPRLVEQMRLVAGAAVGVPLWQEAQIRTLVHAALGGRARGLCFTSHTRLDARDPDTRVRAAILELINLELELIERWPSAGNFAASSATTSDPHTGGAVIETDRSRLMLPIYAPPGGQFVLGTQPAEQVSFKVAGVPEEDNAYELSLTALRPLRNQRVTGGTQVVLDEFNRDSLVVFTQDPHVIRNLKTKLDKNSRRAAQLVRELAAAQLAAHDVIAGRLVQFGPAAPQVVDARAKAGRDLHQFDSLAQVDVAKAYDHGRHALQILRQIERVYWERATAEPNLPLVDPLTASFATLPEHYGVVNRLAGAERSENRLSEGNCENLNNMLRAGWKHYLHPLDGIKTGVDFSPRAAHSGNAGLVLRAEPADPKIKPAAVETPPVWVTTAPVAVEPGDLVQIQVWVRIDAPITLGVDGLVILDTHSGRAVALRTSAAGGWRQITMYRAATHSGPLAVTFAMAGLGEAAIDDVTIQIIRRGPAPAQQAQR